MKILIAGATGFIGSRLSHVLAARGHQIICAVRDPARAAPGLPRTARMVRIDFAEATSAEAWAGAIAGVEQAINAVGILRETPEQRFDLLHRRAPCALFAACTAARVRRVIQVSALGADKFAQSAYHLTKKAADDCLASLPIESAIVQPSLVYGPGGTSAKLFSTMARLPLIPLPGDGEQRVQPVHVDDVIDAMVQLVEASVVPRGRIPLVGPEPLTLREFYARLRAALGVTSPARFMPIPMPVMHAAAALGKRARGMLLDPDTLAMLNRGNTGDPAVITAILGHPPRGVERFAAGADPA